jgi:hypothetical protein
MSKNKRFNPETATKEEIAHELDELSGRVSSLEAFTDTLIAEKVTAVFWQLRLLEKMFETTLANILPNLPQPTDAIEAIIADAKKFILDSISQITEDKNFYRDKHFIDDLLQWIEELPIRLQNSLAFQ